MHDVKHLTFFLNDERRFYFLFDHYVRENTIFRGISVNTG